VLKEEMAAGILRLMDTRFGQPMIVCGFPFARAVAEIEVEGVKAAWWSGRNADQSGGWLGEQRSNDGRVGRPRPNIRVTRRKVTGGGLTISLKLAAKGAPRGGASREYRRLIACPN
jgi:hypothetical protein